MSVEQTKSLISAAERGDLKKIESLLLKSIPIDSTDDENQTALHYASANGHEEVVRHLIKRGAALECQNWTAWTPLLYASYYGHLQTVSALLESKANIEAYNKRQATPLTCAARCGHMSVVELLLERGAKCDPEIVSPTGESKTSFVTPLMTAAQHGHIQIVNLLLQYRANVDYQHPDTGYTALMLAALNGHLEIVQCLVTNGGANTNLGNSSGKNALLLCKNNVEVVEFLNHRTEKREREPSTTVNAYQNLFDAVKGNSEQVSRLIKSGGVDINARDHNGATPLIYACVHKKLDNVKLLLLKGADPNVQDHLQGWTALMQATLRKCGDIVRELLNYNADILIKDSKGLTVFDLATLVGDSQITRLLCPKLGNSKNIDSDRNKPGVKTVFSRVGEKMGLKSRPNQTFSRVPVNDLFNGTTMGGAVEMDEPELRKTGSVLSVLNANGQMHGTRKAKITLVSPQQNLPDDVVAPVLPPYSNLSNFNLPKMPVMGIKLSSSNGSTGEISPYNSSNDSTSLQMLTEANNSRNLARNKQAPNTTFNRTDIDSLHSSFSSGMTSISMLQQRPPVMPNVMFPTKSPPMNSTIKQPTIAWPESSNNSIIAPHKSSTQSSKFTPPPLVQMTTSNGQSSTDGGINEFLARIDALQHLTRFKEEEIDEETLASMNDDELKSIGVDVTLDRQKILTAIKGEAEFEFNKQKMKSHSKHNAIGGTNTSHNFMSPTSRQNFMSPIVQKPLYPLESNRRPSSSSSTSTLSQR